MKTSYNWIKEYIKGDVPEPEEVSELLTDHSFEVEEIKKKGNDWILNIDVLPNRACDCFSHIGVSRELAVILGKEIKFPKSKFKERGDLKTRDIVEIEVKNKKDCKRYLASTVFGIKVGFSPKWLRERLEVCGLQSINNIVDAANYVMLETGQPIHTFDFDKICSKKSNSKIKKIIVRRARKEEKIKTLGDQEYELNKNILVIADEKKSIAIAGIKGGESTGIDSNTKNILIEAANFNQIVVRKGSKDLKLKTDASWRFENGLDTNLADFAQERLISLIQEIAGGVSGKGFADFYPEKRKVKEIELEFAYIGRLLGIEIPKKKVFNILEKLGFGVKERKDKFIVTVPTRRMDVSIQEDLIEEIGRIFGYSKIPSSFPKSVLIPPKKKDEVLWRNTCKDILKEKGFTEAYSYSLIGEENLFGWKKENLIELENPMSAFNKYLRPSLLLNLIKNVKENLKNFKRVKIFEIGKAFEKKNGKFIEKEMMTGVLSEKKGDDNLFYEIKGFLEVFLENLGISDVWFDDYKADPEDSDSFIWFIGKSAEVKSGNKEIGFIGQINPDITKNLGLEEKIFAFDFNFDELIKMVSEENEYSPISFHPSAIRDIAILVSPETKVVEVLNIINSTGGNLIKDVDLFDIYEGEELPGGRKNLAFHIIFQAKDRTLSSEEIEKLQKKIIKNLEENPEWEVRK